MTTQAGCTKSLLLFSSHPSSENVRESLELSKVTIHKSTPSQKPELLPWALGASGSQSSLSAPDFWWSIPCTASGQRACPYSCWASMRGACTGTDYGWMEETSNTGNCMIEVSAKLLIDKSGRRGVPWGTRVFPMLGLPCCPTDLPRSPQIWLPLESEVSATASLARFHCSLSLPFTQHITAHLLSAPPSGSHTYSPYTPKVSWCILWVPAAPCLPSWETPHPTHGDQALQKSEWILKLTGHHSRTRLT